MNMRGILLPLLLAACSAPSETPPLAGAKLGAPFTLTDQTGARITDRAFAGKWRIVYFGYTYCPDVCPVDAQNIAAGLKQVERDQPALGAKVVPLFVTVDPARDTPAVLKQFVGAFHPRMVGLTGSPAEIAALAKSYAVYYRAQPPGPGGGYMVDHSRSGFLMDPDGKPVALLPVEKSGAAVAAELERWVK